MGTAYIQNGCNGDYEDVLGDGACDYEDIRGEPTADTAAPSAAPTSATLGKECVAFALDVASYPELSEVTITMTEVENRPLHVSYTLTAWDADLLTLAANNVETRVENGGKFSLDESDNQWKLNTHTVINDQYLDDGSAGYTGIGEGQWYESTLVQLAAVAGLAGLCCVCGAALWYCHRRRQFKYNLEWMEHQKSVEMHRDTVDMGGNVDVGTPLDEDGNAGAGDTVEDPFQRVRSNSTEAGHGDYI